jgi:uncharacterized membrane protein YqiK
MRDFLRKIRDMSGSMPWWLVLPLGVVWVVLGAFFWLCAGVWLVARFATQQAQRGWRALRGGRAG